MTLPSPRLVSVIIPTRNSGRTLEACLRSIRSQTYPAIEIIVVDNNSEDDTIEIARRHADVVETFGNERSAQRNRGANLSHGDFLLFVDSDMTASEGVVRECVDAVIGSGAPGAIIPEISVGSTFWARARALERSCYMGDDTIEGARFFVRRDFDMARGYDVQLHALEDWDLSRRLGAGRRYARIRSLITHDEGQMRLGPTLVKKRYYATASIRYWRKHGGASVMRTNPIFRRAFVRHWRRLMLHPVLTAGFVSMKLLEGGAGVIGVIDAWLRDRGAHQGSSDAS